jgi:hypothetical protein
MCNKCNSFNIQKYQKNVICLDCEHYEGNLNKETFLLKIYSKSNIENKKIDYNNKMQQMQEKNTNKKFLRFRYFYI